MFVVEPFLSAVLGLSMLVLAFVFLVRGDYYRVLINNLEAQSIGVLLSTVLALFVGVFLVLSHNVWGVSFYTIITVLRWIFLIYVVLWLLRPECMLASLKRICAGKGYYGFVSLVFVYGAQMVVGGIGAQLLQVVHG